MEITGHDITFLLFVAVASWLSWRAGYNAATKEMNAALDGLIIRITAMRDAMIAQNKLDEQEQEGAPPNAS